MIKTLLNMASYPCLAISISSFQLPILWKDANMLLSEGR
jgi:hypothetical protein